MTVYAELVAAFGRDGDEQAAARLRIAQDLFRLFVEGAHLVAVAREIAGRPAGERSLRDIAG
jgi:hypothetical protein